MLDDVRTGNCPSTIYVNGVAKFVTFCLGVPDVQVDMLKKAYKVDNSSMSPMLRRHTQAPYEMNIASLRLPHIDDVMGMFTAFSRLIETPTAPHVLVLGDNFRGPYSEEFLTWLRWTRPSVMRIQQRRIPVAQLPASDYYLGAYSVMSTDELANRGTVCAELEYGVLVYLMYKRYVSIPDDAEIKLTPDQVESLTAMIDESTVDLSNDSNFDGKSELDMLTAAKATNRIPLSLVHNVVDRYPGWQ